jgi:biopolymer transport protein ExbD
VSRSKRARGAEGIFEVNMTPLIDVSLVLVVILMVATPLALQSSIALGTARPTGRAVRDAERLERVEIAVLSDDSVRVGGEVVPRAELPRVLAPLLAKSASREVVVRCADGVSHGVFVGVLDEARALGASRLAVVGR